MKEEFVAVRLSKSKKEYIPSSRYLMWCDNNWYQSGNAVVFNFPMSEIETLKKQLASHFIFNVAFVYQDGKEVVWNYFNKIKPAVQKSKGLTFKIKL